MIYRFASMKRSFQSFYFIDYKHWSTFHTTFSMIICRSELTSPVLVRLFLTWWFCSDGWYEYKETLRLRHSMWWRNFPYVSIAGKKNFESEKWFSWFSCYSYTIWFIQICLKQNIINKHHEINAGKIKQNSESSKICPG